MNPFRTPPTVNVSDTIRVVGLPLILVLSACAETPQPGVSASETGSPVLKPVIVTEKTAVDTDDPAIWIDPDDPSKSLILGTDKGGSVFVFDLDGRIIPDKTVSGMGRMNNIDVAYDFVLGGEAIDIAVATDRNEQKIRVFRLPDMKAVDNGGIVVFEDATVDRRPMGIALYQRPFDGAVYAIVSRKNGPSGSYLWQYRLEDDGDGTVTATKVREFGAFLGGKEIESIAVDNELGYVYYSDEGAGVHKYLADPDAPNANDELAFFGSGLFTADLEGISIYKINDGTGYILVSDQQANTFNIFTREGEPGDPNDHRLVKTIAVSTNESDGSDVSNVPVDPRFPSGIFVAMSDDRTFQYYSWDDIAGDDLVRAPNGVRPD